MMNDLPPAEPATLAAPTILTEDGNAARLMEAFLAAKNPHTLRAYSKALADFTAFLKLNTAGAAASALLASSPGDANFTALSYQADLKARGLGPATINLRLAALRSLVTLARTLGLVTWELEVRNVAAESYRDTRGPGKAGVVKMLAALGHSDDPATCRDRALIRLMFDRGLRRGEVAGLDVQDVDVERGRVRVMGKGRTQHEWLTIPKPTMDAVLAWVAHRGVGAGPLFTNLDWQHDRRRLTTTSIYRIVAKAGRAAGRGHHPRPGLRRRHFAPDRTQLRLRE